MAELFDMKELEERVILVAVSTSDEDDTEASLDELEELADTAGATAIGRWSFSIFSRRMRRRAREKSRLSWHSCVTAQRAWSVCAVPCPVWAAVSVREDRVKRNWRWTAV